MRWAIAVVVLIAATSGLFVCADAYEWPTVEKEGKAWLNAFATDPPAVNVTGVWYAKSWGDVTLYQREGDPEVTGTGDTWGAYGKVSGDTAFIIFSGQGVVQYSAILVLKDPQKLEGVYSRGLARGRNKGKAMRLTKK